MAELAKSACRTWLMLAMSRPLAAASVHTITEPGLHNSEGRFELLGMRLVLHSLCFADSLVSGAS